jgi:hypothetical protein
MNRQIRAAKVRAIAKHSKGTAEAGDVYGCHNRPPFKDMVEFKNGRAPSFPFVMSRGCNYDRSKADEKCGRCKHISKQ